jgi:hypothetical protein
MGVLASIVGSGAGAIIIGASFFAMAYLGKLHLPAMGQSIIRRVLIIAMYAGGCTLAFTEVGILWSGIANRIADLFGGFGTGIPRIVIVLTSLMLLLGLIAGLVFAPADAVIMTAAFVPAVLMLVPGGVLHQVFVTTAAPGQALANSFNVWIAG